MLGQMYRAVTPLVSDASKERGAFIFNIRQSSLYCLPLKMKDIRSSEMSVTVYQSIRHNVPEDLNLEENRGENLTFRTVVYIKTVGMSIFGLFIKFPQYNTRELSSI
jgi:hypothetical protein